jgi:1,2-phenylacetyl-CoA epoxidase catalytic subunit
MFNFCMDRGAGHQLEDVRHSSYGPWRRGVEGIFKEERMHIRHGELWIKRLAENPATRDDAERTFHKWYVRTMNIFGRPGSAKNRLYRELGLKRRDNDEVRRTFSDEVRGLVDALGWRVPRLEARLGNPAGRSSDPRLTEHQLRAQAQEFGIRAPQRSRDRGYPRPSNSGVRPRSLILALRKVTSNSGVRPQNLMSALRKVPRPATSASTKIKVKA